MTRRTKETMSTVKVGQIPGKIAEYAVNGETTIAEVLEEAKLSSSGFEVRLNGDPTEDLSTILKDGDQVVLAKRLKGANS